MNEKRAQLFTHGDKKIITHKSSSIKIMLNTKGHKCWKEE